MSFAVDQCRARHQEHMGSKRRLLAHCRILDVEAKQTLSFASLILLLLFIGLVSICGTAWLNSLKRKWKEGLVIQSCSTPCNPMDYSPPGSSVHGILQARMLECHFLLQGNLSDSGIKPKSPALQVNSLPSEPPGKPSLGFSLTHKRQRKLLQHPKHTSHPESSSHSLENSFSLCVFCLLPKTHIQGGCCPQEQSVRHWRWDSKRQLWRALDGRPTAVPVPGERGYWTRLDHSLATCDGHPLAGGCVQGCVQTPCGLASSHWGQRRGWYLPKQSSCPGAPGSGHTHLPLRSNVTGKG